MKKYVIVGTGHRGTQAYLCAFAKELPDCVTLVGACDRKVERPVSKRNVTLVYDNWDSVPSIVIAFLFCP